MADKAYFAAFLFVLVVTLVKVNAACSPVQYTVKSANNSSWCVNCPTCPQGQEVYLPCGREISTNDLSECRVCIERVTFSSDQDVWSCQTCGYCSEDQVVEKNCTKSSDIVCAKKCRSKDKYYDDNGACMPCSSCCGDGEDVRVKECEEKLGSASNRVCSFHSSHNRCKITTTAATTGTTTAATTITDKQSSPDRPSTTHPPIRGGRVVWITTVAVQTSVPPKDEQSSLPPNKLESTTTTKPPTDHSVAILAVVAVLSVMVVLLIIFRVVFAYRKIKKQRNRRNLDPERGSHSSKCTAHYFSKVPTDDPSNTSDGQVQVFTDEKRTVPDLEEQMRSKSTEPLVEKGKETYKCSCQNGSFDLEKESKKLNSLLEDESALDEICRHLDHKVGSTGHYEAIAAYYEINFFERKDMEKGDRGPSREMFVRLAASHPNLTIKEFGGVVKEKTKRRDVIKLLKKYDNSK